jgi:hypothetical protein
MRKVRVWAGVHADEIEALMCGDSLIGDPLPNVDAGIADPLNRLLGVRSKLCCEFPGDLKSRQYLPRRAAEVILQSQGYYGTIDLHNMNYFGENTGCMSPERGVTPVMLGMLGGLGIRNLVAIEHSLPRFVPNTLVLETVASGLGRDHEKLRTAFNGLANDPEPLTAEAADFNWFTHLGSLHVDQVSPDILPQRARDGLRGFEALPQDVAAQLGFEDAPACLMSWRYEPNENGYWGELVTPIPTPDVSAWPR